MLRRCCTRNCSRVVDPLFLTEVNDTDAPIVYEVSGLAMHHIYNSEKKYCVQQYASGLRGLYLFGKPGRVVVEGPKDVVRRYEHNIKRLRWQKCMVMGRMSFTQDVGERHQWHFRGFDEVASEAELQRMLLQQDLDPIWTELKRGFRDPHRGAPVVDH